MEEKNGKTKYDTVMEMIKRERTSIMLMKIAMKIAEVDEDFNENEVSVLHYMYNQLLEDASLD